MFSDEIDLFAAHVADGCSGSGLSSINYLIKQLKELINSSNELTDENKNKLLNKIKELTAAIHR